MHIPYSDGSIPSLAKAKSGTDMQGGVGSNPTSYINKKML